MADIADVTFAIYGAVGKGQGFLPLSGGRRGPSRARAAVVVRVRFALRAARPLLLSRVTRARENGRPWRVASRRSVDRQPRSHRSSRALTRQFCGCARRVVTSLLCDRRSASLGSTQRVYALSLCVCTASAVCLHGVRTARPDSGTAPAGFYFPGRESTSFPGSPEDPCVSRPDYRSYVSDTAGRFRCKISCEVKCSDAAAVQSRCGHPV